MTSQIKVIICDDESLQINFEEEMTAKEFCAFGNRIARTMNVVKELSQESESEIESEDETESKKSVEVKVKVKHKPTGRPKGIKNGHGKKASKKLALIEKKRAASRAYYYKMKAKAKSENAPKLEEVPESPVDEDKLKPNEDENYFDRDTVKGILSAHYALDESLRDSLMEKAHMDKAVFYTMKNSWVKKYGFTSSELGL